MAAVNPSYVDAIVNAFGAGRLFPARATDELLLQRPGSRRLVVILHQYGGVPRTDLGSVMAVAAEALPDADLLAPVLPLHYTSFHDPDAIVAGLLARLDHIQSSGRYEHITLVGHSMGSLLARKLYVAACGELPGSPLEPPFAGSGRRPWADKVDRIVLLAGMNRGWSFSHHLQIGTMVVWSLGLLIMGTLRWLRHLGRRTPLVEHLRRGAPFVTRLRLQWLALRQWAAANHAATPLTVQLLGSVDDLVSPEDNVDPVAGADFVYLDVPHTGHISIIFMDPLRPRDRPADSEAERAAKLSRRVAAAGRAAIFRAALVEPRETLQARAVTPFDKPFDHAQPQIDRVVFVVHGIRDLGYWTHKIARRVRELGSRHAPPLHFATETSTYGYFAMLPFLALRQRRGKVEWLMERYAEARARYPNAVFSYVGHSNGTWLLARALETYPACRFEHVVFAGSVVRSGFDWRPFLARRGAGGPQIGKLCNFVATGDWVVALFPKAFERLVRRLDLGGAGHDGFAQTADGAVVNLAFVRGAHGAAIREEVWDSIARFIVDGTPEVPPAGEMAEGHDRCVELLGRWAPLPLLAILAAVAGLGLAMLLRPQWLGLGSAPEWLRTTIFLGYLWLVHRVVTRI